MKKLLTLLLSAVGVVTPAAAYTVDEIVSTTPTMLVEYIYANYYDNDFYLYPYHHASECVTLKKGSDDQHIILSGIAGTLDFEFELVTSEGELTSDGEQLQIDGYQRAVGTSKGREGWFMICTQWTRLKYTNHRDKHTVLDIKKGSDGFYFSEADDAAGVFGFMVLPAGTVELPNYSGVVVDKFNFSPFKEINGTATATLRQYDTVGSSDQLIGTVSTNLMTANLYMVDEHKINYPVKVDFGSNNTFSILNLNNMGYAVDATDTRQMTGQLTTVSGSYDPVAGTATLKAGSPGLWEWGHIVVNYWGSQYLDWGLYYFSLTPFTDINGQKNEPIVGTYTSKEGPYHNTAAVDFGWVTPRDHGKRRTYEGASMSFPAMTYCAVGNVFYATPNWLDTYHDTEILCGADVTLDVDLNLEAVQWHERDGVYVTGSITTNANDMYVDSYDVLLVKGKYDHIEQTGFKPNDVTGHADAVVLCKGAGDAYNEWNRPKGAAALSADGNHDYRFAKLITPAELGHNPENGDYTLFIRANYKVAGLEPTFHSLQYITAPVHTAVDDLIGETAAPEVKAVAGGIEVSGTEAQVNVVDMTGRTVYSGNAGVIELPAGIYIVRVGSYTVKTAVR